MKKLYVFKKAELAGTLLRTETGAAFQYDEGFKGQVALSLPPGKPKDFYLVVGDNLHPFFAGLLPEGRRLEVLLSSTKTSPDDMFSLLSEVHGDFIGDVSVAKTPVPTPPPAMKNENLVFEELFNLSANNKDLGISGVQPKLSADRLTLPFKRKGLNYILKLGSAKYPCLVKNEHFFMMLAARCGIEAAKTEIVFDDNDTPGLLVQRFDRETDKKLWCEDICQVLAKYPADKYNITTRDVLSAITAITSAPVVQALKCLEQFMFSYLICNGDMHGKNVSLLQKDGFFTISPGYDLLSTFPYGDETLALQVEGRDKNLNVSSFCTLGERAGVSSKATRSSAVKIASEIKKAIPNIGQIGFDKKLTAKLQKEIERRLGSF